MDREELERGLKETSRHILSHHRPDNHYRCYSLSFLSREIHLCARCTGIYPGILTGIIQLYFGTVLPLYIIALSGVPTLIEKYLTGVKEYRGYNSVRTLTGLILGIGYVNGVYLFLQNPFRPEIIVLTISYLTAALALILQQRQKDKTPN